MEISSNAASALHNSLWLVGTSWNQFRPVHSSWVCMIYKRESCGLTHISHFGGSNYSTIHQAAGSLVTGCSLYRRKNVHTPSMGEQPHEAVLYGGRQSGGLVNRAVIRLTRAGLGKDAGLLDVGRLWKRPLESPLKAVYNRGPIFLRFWKVEYCYTYSVRKILTQTIYFPALTGYQAASSAMKLKLLFDAISCTLYPLDLDLYWQINFDTDGIISQKDE